MKTVLKILVCLVLMVSTLQCSVEANDSYDKASAEVDRRLSTLTPDELHNAICRIALLSDDYSVTGLKKLGGQVMMLRKHMASMSGKAVVL